MCVLTSRSFKANTSFKAKEPCPRLPVEQWRNRTWFDKLAEIGELQSFNVRPKGVVAVGMRFCDSILSNRKYREERIFVLFWVLGFGGQDEQIVWRSVQIFFHFANSPRRSCPNEFMSTVELWADSCAYNLWYPLLGSVSQFRFGKFGLLVLRKGYILETLTWFLIELDWWFLSLDTISSSWLCFASSPQYKKDRSEVLALGMPLDLNS